MDANTLGLPVKRNLKPTYIVSFIIALLMTGSSITGFLYRDQMYPSEELVLAFVPNDIVNLVVGLPILLISMWLTSRRKLLGLLFWPGALFYVFYNYLIYVFAMPINLASLFNLFLVTISAYALIDLLALIQGTAIREALSDNVPERLAGGVLTGLGLLFLLRVIVIFIRAIINSTPLTETEMALNISDFMISPAPIIGGILLWLRKEFGYVIGLGLLFQQSMLFIGLIAVLIIQPLLINVPFALIDVVVVFIMGLICFVPFILFARGVISSGNG